MTVTEWEIPVAAPPRDVDRDELERATKALWRPGELRAVQGLPSGRWEVAGLDDAESAFEAARTCAGGAGVYATINPLRRGFVRGELRGFGVGQFETRKWILIDVDPVRPKGASATDAEKAAAAEVLDAIVERIDELHWPAPPLTDSGNGYHVYVPVELSADAISRELVKAFLAAWGARFDTDRAKVDRVVHNVNRIAKLPGTWARKGEATADRPHRKVRLLVDPGERGRVVTAAMLEKEISPERTAIVQPPAAANGWAIRVKAPGSVGYAAAALEAEAAKVESATSGRNVQLHEAALKMGGYVAGGELAEADVVARLTAAGRACGLGTDGDPEEIARAIRNGLDAGATTPKHVPPRSAVSVRQPRRDDPAAATPDGEVAEPPARLVKLASEFEPRPVEWLWPGLIPKRKLTTLAGAGGLGKSFVCADLAARVSVGGEIPGGGGERFRRGNVLIINCEDDPEDTTVPRLIAAGADRSAIGLMEAGPTASWTLGDVKTLERAVAEMGGVEMVVVDPATAFVGGVDDHKNAQLQGLLAAIRIAAWWLEAAIILLSHVNKAIGNRNVDAAARVVGGVAWVNAVRAASIFVRDPEDPTARLMVPFKSNNGPERKGLRYRIEPTDTLARVAWDDRAVDIAADDALRSESPAKTGKRTDAEIDAAIRGLFDGRMELPSKRVDDFCKAERISWRARDAAKQRLGLKCRQKAGDDGERGWWWLAPVEWMTAPRADGAAF